MARSSSRPLWLLILFLMILLFLAPLRVSCEQLEEIPLIRPYRMVGTQEEDARERHVVSGPMSDDEAERLCRHPYFAINAQNLADSNVAMEYMTWTVRDEASIKANGELKQFGDVFLHNPNFKCGIDEDCQQPSCFAIVKRYRGDLEEARLVYFSHYLINFVNRHLRITRNAVLEAHVSSGFESAQAERLFTQQPNPRADWICKTFNDILNIAIKAVFQTAEKAINVPDKSLTVIQKMVMKAAKFAVKESHYKDLPKKIEIGKDIVHMVGDYLTPKSQVAPPYYRAFEIAYQPVARGMCSAFDAGYTIDDWKTWATSMREFNRYIKKARDSIMDTASMANQGNYQFTSEVKTVGSQMANFLVAAVVNYDSMQADITNAKALYHDMHQIFMNRIIQMYWTSFNSYMKCARGSYADTMCANLGDQTVIDRSRGCPAPGVICQIQSLTMSESVRERPLNGLDSLSDYNTTSRELIQNSYDHAMQFGGYQMSGYEVQVGRPRYTKLTLPTCIGWVSISDFTKGNAINCDREDCKRIPISCGSWKGEQFEDFFKQFDIGFGSNHAKDMWKLEQRRFTYDSYALFHWRPVAQFLSECNRKAHFPIHGERGKLRQPCGACFNPMMPGASPHCDAMRAELASISDLDEATRYFCTESPTARKIFRTEVDYSDALPAPRYRSKRKTCREFMMFVVGNSRTDARKKWPHLW